MKRKIHIKKEEEEEDKIIEINSRLSHDEIMYNFVPDASPDECVKYQCLFQVVLAMKHQKHTMEMMHQKDLLELERERNKLIREQNTLLRENTILQNSNAKST